ncbi:unnamed protein product [marine sediment metagenome]|uniref:Uncharacterized protein n=1 Tax=marine sediment metagenome TaxID=412755 RepID=X0XYC0_9ZZZZ
MKKYEVYGVTTASISLGAYEADTKEDAINQACQDEDKLYISLCHYCASKIDVGEIDKFVAREVK